MSVPNTYNLPAVIAGDDFFLMGRVRGPDGWFITQGSLSAISYSVWDDYAHEMVVEGDVDIATTVFDELQTNGDDPRFPARGYGAGYNFGHLIEGTAIPIGSRMYEVRYAFTPLGGRAFHWSVKLPAQNP